MWTAFKGEALLETKDKQAASERGFRSRFKLNADGVSVHLSSLVPGVQNAHRHDVLFELVMLVKGSVVAVRWDDTDCIETFALKSPGDTVIFNPGLAHTLIVERDSQVVVVRYAKTDANPNERIPLELPAAIVAAQAMFPDNPRSVVDAILEASSQEEQS